MGIYIYTLRKDTKQVATNTEIVTVARADFAYKETMGLQGHQRSKLAAAERARMALGDVDLVAFGDWEEGTSVRRVHDNWFYGYDTPSFPGELVGFLHKEKVGRRTVWTIQPKE